MPCHESERLTVHGPGADLVVTRGPSSIAATHATGRGDERLGLVAREGTPPSLEYHAGTGTYPRIAVILGRPAPVVQLLMPGAGHEVGRLKRISLDELLRVAAMAESLPD